MLRRSCVWLVVLLALAGAWPSGQLRADGDRPFRGSAAGMVTGVAPPNELIIEYTGTATHLGRFTREEHLFLNADGSFTGTMVFTAANGDELWLDFEGAFSSATTAEGTYTFTGGTGRFSGATGGATFEAYTPDGIHVEARFEGTIRY
ncbi:MAG TPA: hypothetical protein VMZ71_04340 [Gemmataceae bacterium]|nr:hypothetical protein [Gemmataceae bacterium]